MEELDAVTKFVTKNCRDYDFDFLRAELKAYRDDWPQYLLEALEKRLRSIPKGGFPTGYTRMNIAVVKARTAVMFEAARDILASVTLSEQDFPWLEDVRTLALADAASRFGISAFENERVEAFLLRQPMLFEPDIALNFHLLRYQEKLKRKRHA